MEIHWASELIAGRNHLYMFLRGARHPRGGKIGTQAWQARARTRFAEAHGAVGLLEPGPGQP